MPRQAEGEFAQVKERLEFAQGLSGQPVKRGTMAHKHIVYMMLVDAASQAKDVETILKYAPLLEELALRDSHQPYLAVCHRAYGVAHLIRGEFDKSEARLKQAQEVFDSLGMVWQTGRTLAVLGNLAQATDDVSRYEELVSQARELFECIQAQPDMESLGAA